MSNSISLSCPNEILINIFTNYDLRPYEYIRISTVNKQWHLCMRHEVTARHIYDLLKQNNLIPNRSYKKDFDRSWSLLRRARVCLYEIYVDNSISMGRNMNEQLLNLKAIEKTRQLLNDAHSFLVYNPLLYSFNVRSRRIVWELAKTRCANGTSLASLTERVLAYSKKTAQTKLFIVSDLDFSPATTAPFLNQIKLIKELVNIHQNFHLSFVKISNRTPDHKNSFEKSLNTCILDNAISYVTVIEDVESVEPIAKKQKL